MRMEIEKVLEAMREDYKRWTMATRTVHQNVEEFNRAIDIREKMTEEYCNSVSERYIELFEYITGDKFVKEDVHNVINRVEQNILKYLSA